MEKQYTYVYISILDSAANEIYYKRNNVSSS